MLAAAVEAVAYCVAIVIVEIIVFAWRYWPFMVLILLAALIL